MMNTHWDITNWDQSLERAIPEHLPDHQKTISIHVKQKFERQKPRIPLLSIIYRLAKLPFATPNGKMRFFLDLNWIFWRLSLEQGEKMYEFSDVSMRRRNIEFLLSRLKDKDRVMDLGCKHGHISYLMAERAQHVLGVDKDTDALQVARERYSKNNLEFVEKDAIDILKGGKEQFNVIVLSHILEHLDDPKELLNRIKDHCEHIYIEVPDMDDSYLNHYRLKVNARLRYTDNDHIWEFDRESLIELIKECGLSIGSSEYRYGLQKYWCHTPRTASPQ